MSAEAKVQQLKLELPPPGKPLGIYRPALIVGDLCYVSGHGPLRADGTLITGCVGDDLTQEAGYQAAQQTGLAILTHPQVLLWAVWTAYSAWSKSWASSAARRTSISSRP